MSYSYMLVSLTKPINNFRKFHKENVIPLNMDLEDVKSIIGKLFPSIEWIQHDENTVFGGTPCGCTTGVSKHIEVWIIGKPVDTLSISRAHIDEVVIIGDMLKMTIIDVQTGEVIKKRKS